jgi:hypothetical protein
MAFERFVRIGRIYTPTASIWSRGQIGFNQGAVQKYNIAHYKYAVLFYDKDTNRIGVKFSNDNSEPGSVPITMGKTGAMVSAKAFLDYWNISHDRTRKYPMAHDEQEKLYVIQLDRPLGSVKE